MLTLLIRHQSLGTLSLLGPDHTVLYLPAPCPLDVPMHDFSHSADLYQAGYEMANTFIVKLDLTGPGIYGHPHFHDTPLTARP